MADLFGFFFCINVFCFFYSPTSFSCVCVPYLAFSPSPNPVLPPLALTRRSSVTRISVPDRNMLLHQDMAKERRELELKIHGKDMDKDKVIIRKAFLSPQYFLKCMHCMLVQGFLEVRFPLSSQLLHHSWKLNLPCHLVMKGSFPIIATWYQMTLTLIVFLLMCKIALKH